MKVGDWVDLAMWGQPTHTQLFLESTCTQYPVGCSSLGLSSEVKILALLSRSLGKWIA